MKEEEEVDLLREASDPTTPGERLRAIAQSDLMSRPPASFEELARKEAVTSALYANPSLPLDLLRASLLADGTEGRIWFHPSVSSLLSQRPRPEFQRAACTLLAYLSLRGLSVGHTKLAGHVAAWASLPPGLLKGRQADMARERRALARHLAGLFRLPWPGEAP